jgi:hypothetical protein
MAIKLQAIFKGSLKIAIQNFDHESRKRIKN